MTTFWPNPALHVKSHGLRAPSEWKIYSPVALGELHSLAMPSRKMIPGVLHNFLGTFTSRYSDLDGYWLFGLLIESLNSVRIDLLEKASELTDTPSGFAASLAVQRFREQLAKAGLPKEWFHEAYLEIAKLPERRANFVNGWNRSGYDVSFQARTVTDLGRAYGKTTSIFVAPHDPKIELRSTRAV
jgi:hypothetical protein